MNIPALGLGVVGGTGVVGNGSVGVGLLLYEDREYRPYCKLMFKD